MLIPQRPGEAGEAGLRQRLSTLPTPSADAAHPAASACCSNVASRSSNASLMAAWSRPCSSLYVWASLISFVALVTYTVVG